jgi:hyperosmotically inducible protein
MRTRFITTGLLIVALLAPRAARAQVTDTELANAVATSVRHYSRFSIFDDVTITVSNRCVTLSGRVTQPLKRDEIGARIAKIDGIRTLTNDIGVLPTSSVDADLRQRLARAIYGNPAFWRYAGMTDPPIHMVVENSRVTLTGYVNDEGERALAFALAQIPGVMNVKNELRIDKS